MTTDKAQELAAQNNTQAIVAEESQKNYQYGDTPIWVRGNEEMGYFATIGDRKISQDYRHEQELIERLQEKDWEILLNIIVTVFETMTSDKFKEYRENQ